MAEIRTVEAGIEAELAPDATPDGLPEAAERVNVGGVLRHVVTGIAS